jgi:hypothetical protein
MGLWKFDDRMRAFFIISGVLVSFLLLYPIHENKDLLVVLNKSFFVNGKVEYNTWPDQLAKASHLFQNLPCPPDYPGCHAGKLSFRLTIPILLNVFGFDGQWVYVFQLFLGIFFLYGVYRLALRGSANQFLAAGFLLCFIASNAGQAVVYEYRGLGDGFSFIFLLFAVLSKRNYLRFFFFQCAFWTDERSLVASLGVAFYWLCQSDEATLKSFGSWASVRDFLFRSRQMAVLWASYFVYLAVRQYLTVFQGLKIPMDDANFSILLQYANWRTAIPIILTHKFLLVYMLIGALYLVRIRAWLILTAYVGFIVLYHLVAHMVFDTSRSMGYGYFIYFIAFGFSCRLLGEQKSRKLMYAGLFITMVIFPIRHLIFR